MEHSTVIHIAVDIREHFLGLGEKGNDNKVLHS